MKKERSTQKKEFPKRIFQQVSKTFASKKKFPWKCVPLR